MRRTERIEFVATEAERAELEALCKNTGQTMAQALRSLIRQARINKGQIFLSPSTDESDEITEIQVN